MKRWIAVILAVLLTLAAGCGSVSSAPSTLEQGSVSASGATPERFAELLAQDYELYYLIYFGGLELDYAVEREGYYAVSQEGYGTLSALRAHLADTYTEAGVELVLSTVDAVGRPLFAEYDGALYRSGSGAAYGMLADYDDAAIALAENPDGSVAASVTETDETGTAKTCTMTLKNESGVWLLDAPRITLSQVTQQPDEPETPRAAAEAFLAALVSADISAIERYAGAPEGLYASWKGITVDSATLTETLEETETGGSYLAALSVENAYGLLMPGKTVYRLIIENRFLTDENAARPVAIYFQPAENDPYNHLGLEQRDDAACDLAMRYLELYGAQAFASPAALGKQTMTEFALYLLDLDSNGETVFSAETLAAKLAEVFGHTDAPDDSFYSEAAGGYLFYGRHGSELHYELSRSVTKNGVTTVGVDMYTDNLQTQGHTWLVFTLSANGDGSFRLISAE